MRRVALHRPEQGAAHLDLRPVCASRACPRPVRSNKEAWAAHVDLVGTNDPEPDYHYFLWFFPKLTKMTQVISKIVLKIDPETLMDLKQACRQRG